MAVGFRLLVEHKELLRLYQGCEFFCLHFAVGLNELENNPLEIEQAFIDEGVVSVLGELGVVKPKLSDLELVEVVLGLELLSVSVLADGRGKQTDEDSKLLELDETLVVPIESASEANEVGLLERMPALRHARVI